MSAQQSFLSGDEGATAIEYALVASLAAIIAIGGMTLFANAASSMFMSIATHL